MAFASFALTPPKTFLVAVSALAVETVASRPVGSAPPRPRAAAAAVPPPCAAPILLSAASNGTPNILLLASVPRARHLPLLSLVSVIVLRAPDALLPLDFALFPTKVLKRKFEHDGGQLSQ